MAATDAPGKPPGMPAEAFDDYCRLAAHAVAELRDCRFVRGLDAEVVDDGLRVEVAVRPAGSAAPLASILTDERFSVADVSFDSRSTAGRPPVGVVVIEIEGEVYP